MIVSDFITNDVRGQISDKVSGYRWSDPVVLAYVNDGLRRIRTEHPEAFCVSSVVTGPVSDLTSVSDDLGITQDFIIALSHYVCHRVLGEDSEDASNQTLSQWHFDHYTRAVA